MLVGKGGLEPPLPYENQILNLARLPIPPLAQDLYHLANHTICAVHIPLVISMRGIAVATNVLYNRT
jgi:hypothetical protein